MATDTLVGQRRALDPELEAKLCRLMEVRYGRGRVAQATETFRRHGLNSDNTRSVLLGLLAFLGDDYEEYFRWGMETALPPDLQLTFEEREILSGWLTPQENPWE